MADKQKPLVSAAELDALIMSWGENPTAPPIDKYFPLRFWFLILVPFSYSMWLLFFTENVAMRMTSDPSEIIRMSRFLYFRGWFILIAIIVGLYSYINNWYLGITFLSMFLVGCVNFTFDLFNIYAEVLNNPSPRITAMFTLRIIGVWFIFLTFKNSSRIPELKDRFNPLLPFRKV